MAAIAQSSIPPSSSRHSTSISRANNFFCTFFALSKVFLNFASARCNYEVFIKL